MEEGHSSKHYLLQAIEGAINWPEAQASWKNDSESWARFIYEELICRFGCIPYCVTDGGPEFLGAAEILFKQYGIIVIVSSPYHPQGNATVERSHQTLGNSIRHACGKELSKWPLYVHAALLAMRCTISQMTGYTPYFLLYRRHPILAFDITNRTWEVLDWHTVHSMEDLIAIHTQQILQWDKKLIQVHKSQWKNRQ
jgi:transposase InsO family protein